LKEEEKVGEYDRGRYEDCWCGGCGRSGQMEDEGGRLQIDGIKAREMIY